MEDKKEKQQTKAGKSKEPDFLSQYRRCYPKNNTFYVTTDRMVFLEKDKNLAEAHQKGIGEGEIVTY